MLNLWRLAMTGVAIIVGSGFITLVALTAWIDQGVRNETGSQESRVAVAPRGGLPIDTAIADCNQVASAQAESQRDTATGGGSLYGLDASRRHDEAYRAAYARCMADRGYRS